MYVGMPIIIGIFERSSISDDWARHHTSYVAAEALQTESHTGSWEGARDAYPPPPTTFTFMATGRDNLYSR